MSVDRVFRLCDYATLGLSCMALVFAETSFLPDLQVYLAPVLALLVLAWWVEGRWSLPAWGANVLAVLIAGGGVAWLATQLGDQDSLLALVPLQLALVPYMGPLVMAALLVKVFRPRGPGDFWRLQGLGLIQVSLGCVLASGPEFGAVLAAYLASALTCLALRYRLSGRGAAEAPPRAPARWLLVFALRWTPLVAVLALVLFLLTPRHDSFSWEPLANFRAENGPRSHQQAGPGEEINLNREGIVDLDEEIAFRVVAADVDGQPKLDLPGDQRWRGTVLDWYEGGRWTVAQQAPSALLPRRRQRQLPDFGAGQYYLTFTVTPRQAGGLLLAEPVRLGPPPTRLPVVTTADSHRTAPFFEMIGTVLPMLFSARQEYRYRQVVPAAAGPERTPAEGMPLNSYFERLTRHNIADLHDWTFTLLGRLSREGRYRLPDEVRRALAGRGRSFLLRPDHWEPVARVLTDYLAGSGEFTYTLALTHQDRQLDPVMDFLVNVRQGHCERYATALALMLRSVGIPSRIVKGYHGAEHQGEGVYVVRHNQAHAWVEILVPRSGAGPDDFDWLTLDPTPADTAPAAARFSAAHLWQELRQNAGELWRTLIVDYNADEQADLWTRLQPGGRLYTLMKFGGPALLILAALLTFGLVRRLRRRRAARARPSSAGTLYARLLALLARRASLRPASGQTPREFGAAASQALHARPGVGALADLPGRVVESFYQVRFGGRPLSEAEDRALDAELDQLAVALRENRNSARPT
jgi:hypothetical protein